MNSELSKLAAAREATGILGRRPPDGICVDAWLRWLSGWVEDHGKSDYAATCGGADFIIGIWRAMHGVSLAGLNDATRGYISDSARFREHYMPQLRELHERMRAKGWWEREAV